MKEVYITINIMLYLMMMQTIIGLPGILGIPVMIFVLSMQHELLLNRWKLILMVKI